MNAVNSETHNKDDICVQSECVATDVQLSSLASDEPSRFDIFSNTSEIKNECRLKVTPVPKPRLSLLTKKMNNVHTRNSSMPNIEDQNEFFPCRPPRRKSECPQPTATNVAQFTADVAQCDTVIYEKQLEKEMNDNKTNTHSTAFQKLGNLLRNKKLSFRRNSKAKSKINEEVNPMRPKRCPPSPPSELHFRPPAPLPVYSYEPEVYEHGSTLTFYDRESQYTSDSDVYATIGDKSSFAESSDHYEDLSDYEKLTESDEDLYQDAYECQFSDEQIYEVLPGEDHCSDNVKCDPHLYVDADNNYCRKVHSHSERKVKRSEKKRALRAAKLRKKFNLTGNEIPVNAGVVIEDAKGAGCDLLVHKGEVVLILRMEGNPPGKWLVKNERDKIGFVDLQNIDVDPESIKSIMKIPALYET